MNADLISRKTNGTRLHFNAIVIADMPAKACVVTDGVSGVDETCTLPAVLLLSVANMYWEPAPEE